MRYFQIPPLFVFIACLLVSGLSSADDTEIYTNVNLQNQEHQGKPNVLLMLDTSGSMVSNTLPAREPYDPDIIYSPFEDINDSYFYLYDSSLTKDISEAIPKEIIHCNAAIKAIEKNPERPVFLDAYIVTSNNRWADIKEPAESINNNDAAGDDSNDLDIDDPVIECAADEGIHGHNSDRTNIRTYAARNNDRWTRNSQNRFDFPEPSLYLVSANYHAYLQDNSQVTLGTREQVLKDTVNNLLDTFTDINLGIMTFPGGLGKNFDTDYSNGDEGINNYAGRSGMITNPIEPISDNKESLKATVNAIESKGGTPLANSLYEANLYFSGGFSAYHEKQYQSPMNKTCQKNVIIMLTDGTHDGDGYYNKFIRQATSKNCFYKKSDTTSAGSCLDELAENLYSTDLRTDIQGTQNITTHTIGFDLEPGQSELIETAARKGGGVYKSANNAGELNAAFVSLLASISSKSNTFTAPTVPISNYNALQNSNDLYFALFKPGNTARWDGNIKRYEININDGGIAEIVDYNKDPVIDDKGNIRGGSLSWWSEEIDGEEIAAGGVAGKLEASGRNLYTFLGDDNRSRLNSDLTASRNRLTRSNSGITGDLLGARNNNQRNRWLEWIEGKAIGSEGPHQFLGDPLHSRPIAVTYGTLPNGDPDSTIFYGTNLGFIYANDTHNGEERFAFMPKELLKNISTFYKDENIDIANGKPYGMDGELAVWIKENPNDSDRNIEPNEGDKVMIYATMRRGGSSIYALDVSNRDRPRLAWQINPNTGNVNNNRRRRFSDLGQSWSRPQVTKVKWRCRSQGNPDANNCQEKNVLFFGGGYDNRVYDDAGSAYYSSAQKGNAVYMVDAETGQYLWSSGGRGEGHILELEHFTGSVPSEVAVVDINYDGYADILYVVDIQGHYFRFDINDAPSSRRDFAKGQMIADFSDRTNATRFFNGLDIGLQRPRGGESFYTIATTTGNRVRPKTQKDTADKVIVLFDTPVFTDKPANTVAATLSNLQEIQLTTTARSLTSGKKGWYLEFAHDRKEKGLSRTLTYDNHLLFGTYLPDNAEQADICAGSLGSSRFYQLHVGKGYSTLRDDKNVKITFREMAQQGIPSAPAIMNIGDKKVINGQTKTTIKPILCIGTECQEIQQDGNLKRLYWRQVKPAVENSSATPAGDEDNGGSTE